MRKMWLRFLVAGVFLLPPLAVAVGQSPPAVLGTWTGKVAQNKGSTGYTVVMTISANAAETEYPELKCGGKLTRVGASNGYAFFTEAITHGGKKRGGGVNPGALTGGPGPRQDLWGGGGGQKRENLAASGGHTRNEGVSTHIGGV